MNRLGNSFINCMNDVYRQPIGFPPYAGVGTGAFDVFFTTCQLDAPLGLIGNLIVRKTKDFM